MVELMISILNLEARKYFLASYIFSLSLKAFSLVPVSPQLIAAVAYPSHITRFANPVILAMYHRFPICFKT